MNVLIIKSSAQGSASVSSAVADSFAAALRAERADVAIVERDVGRDPIPHLTEQTVAGIRAEAATDTEHAAAALSDALIAEVKAADLIVIASPMYNFGISSTLKSWFDHVLRPRVAFRYVDGQPQGLLGGRKAVVIESRAGFYSEGPAAAMDSQEPHLRSMLNFVGIADVTIVRADKLAFGPEAAAASVTAANAALAQLARADLPLAA